MSLSVYNFILNIFQGPQKVKFGKVGFSDNVITAKNIIIATGSVPFVPKGIEVDGKCSSFPDLSSPWCSLIFVKGGSFVYTL